MDGNYTLSGTLPSNPAALIYVFEIKRIDFDSYVDIDNVIQFVETDFFDTYDFAISDEITAITTGTAKFTDHWPFNFKAFDVFAGLTVVSTSGNVTIDINDKDGNTIFSTRPTVLVNEFTSLTNGTQPVLSTISFTKGDKFTVDIDLAGTGAKGVKIHFRGIKS